MENIHFEILAILLLIAINGFFSLSEFSIIASRKSRLKRMTREGSRSAERAYKLHIHPEPFLATIQVMVTFVGIMSGVFGGIIFVDYLSAIFLKIPVDFIAGSAKPIASVVIAAVITFAIVVAGELVPKYIALSKPERIASSISFPIEFFTKISFVPVTILIGTARIFMRILGIKRLPDKSALTEEEINLLIAEGLEMGVFEATEREMIHSVFEFTDTTARQAMTPRTDIIGIDTNDDSDKILRTVAAHGFSRYPVYENTLDKVIGILHTKDLIRIMQHSTPIAVNDIIRKTLFVPDSMKLSVLLKVFQQKRVHAAIVLDEYGGTAGLITLEDLLEEIVGEIQDEFDSEQRQFVKKTENLAFVAGSLRVDELNDRFQTRLPTDRADTVAGLVFEMLGRPAAKGEEVVAGSIRFKVLEIEGNRVKRLSVRKKAARAKKGEN
jgi:putative hemolysin